MNAEPVFDTLTVSGLDASLVHVASLAKNINLKHISATSVGISLDEVASAEDVKTLISFFKGAIKASTDKSSVPASSFGVLDKQVRYKHSATFWYF